VPKPSLDLVEVNVIEAFTVTRPYGQFHGDPDSENNSVVRVPSDAVEDLAARGKIKPPEMPATSLADLRAAYAVATGKRPFPAWGADELRRRMDAAKAAETGGDNPGNQGPPA